MNVIVDSLAYWLADFYLAATVLFVAALVAMRACSQPAKRLAVAKAALVAAALLAALCALPGWSVVSLGGVDAGESTEAASAVIPSNVARVNDVPRFEVEPVAQSVAPLSRPKRAEVAWNWDIPWLKVLVAGFFVGCVAVAMWLVFGVVAAMRLVRRAENFPGELREALRGATDVGELLVSREIDVPVALGVFRPLVLLPQEWVATRSARELSTVLAHEAAHIRNHDLRWLAASRLLLVVLWAQPLYWWLRRQMRLDQETLADAAAAEVAGRQAYAEQLVAWARGIVTRPRPFLPASVGLWEGASQLRRRVAVLVDERFTVLSRCPRGWAAASIVLASAIVIVLSSATFEPFDVARAEEGQATEPTLADASDANAELEKSLGISYDRQGGVVAGDEIVGVVLDEQGKPLANVLVDAWTWYPGNETRTDAKGRFRLAGFERDQEVEIEFSKDGYCPRLFVTMPAGRVNWKITLNNRTYLEGRVTRPDGNPAAGAKVRAWRGPFENPDVSIDQVWTDAVADDEGRYRMYVEPASYHVQVRVPEIGLFRDDNVTLKDGDHYRLDIPLAVGPRFEAKAVDSVSGEPVQGIQLWHWMQPGIEGVSDRDGKLVIENMMLGKFTFNVASAGERRPNEIAGDFARWWSPQALTEWERKETPQPGVFQRNLDDLSFDIQRDMAPAEIYVEKCVTIRGVVTDPDGKPVAGATVAPARTGTGNSLTGDTRYSVRTDQDGKFELRLPASGEAKYNLVAHDGDYQQWRNWANGVGELLQTQPGQVLEGVKLQLTRPCLVRGKVVDANGKPVPGHEVRAQAADKLENRYYDPTTSTNERGEFELRFVRAGKQIVQAEPFWLVAEQGPASARSEIVADPDRPVEGLEFKPVDEPQQHSLRTVVDELREKAVAGGKEDEREEKVEEVDAQTKHLSIGGGMVNSFVVGVPVTPWDYEPNAVRLEVEDEAGKPLAGGEATLFRVTQATGEREPVREATSDEKGVVEFPDVVAADAAREFRERLASGEFPGSVRDVFYVVLKQPRLGSVILPVSDFTVASRGSKRRVRMRPAAELTGRVTDAEGKPVSGATVAVGTLGGVFALDGANATVSDSNGEFHLANLNEFDRDAAMKRAAERGRDVLAVTENRKGDYAAIYDPAEDFAESDLVATHPDFAVTRVAGGNIPGSAKVVMKAAAAIEGRVVEFGTGAPAAGVLVKAVGQVSNEDQEQTVFQPVGSLPLYGSQHAANTRTDADGRYRLANLPAGRYEVWAQSGNNWQDAEWVSTGVTNLEPVPGGAALEAADLVTGPGGKIDGRLVDAATGKAVDMAGKKLEMRAAFFAVDGPTQQQGQLQEVPVGDDGKFTVRAFPGRSRLFVDVRRLGEAGQPAVSEYRSPDGFDRSGQVFELGHGETIEADVPVMSTVEQERLRGIVQRGFEALQANDGAKAIQEFSEAIAISPEERSALGGRAQAYDRSGQFADAIGDYERLVELEPDVFMWQNNLAELLATSPNEADRDGARAVELAKRAIALADQVKLPESARANLLDTLAAAQAEAGDFGAAVKTQREAIEKAPEGMRGEMRKRLEAYEAAKAWRREVDGD